MWGLSICKHAGQEFRSLIIKIVALLSRYLGFYASPGHPKYPAHLNYLFSMKQYMEENPLNFIVNPLNVLFTNLSVCFLRVCLCAD